MNLSLLRLKPLRAIFVLLLLAVPLMTGTVRLNTTGKILTFEVLSGLMLIVVLAQQNLEHAVPNFLATVRRGPNLPIVLFVLVAGISCLLSPYPAFSRTEFLRVGFCALIYFVAAYKIGNARWTANTLLLAGAAVALFELSILSTVGVMSDRPQSAFGSHELLGSFALLILPLALAFSRSSEPIQSSWAQAVALLMAIVLLVALARTAWIGSFAALLTLVLLMAKFPSAEKRETARKKKTTDRARWVMPVFLLVIVGIGLALTLDAVPGLPNRAATLGKVAEDSSLHGRKIMWGAAFQALRERPLMGWGLGTYPVEASTWTHRGDTPEQVLTRGTSHSNLAHNLYLQTGAELGTLGLGLYLCILAAFFRRGYNALKRMTHPSPERWILIGCLASMSGQAVDAWGSPAYNFASVSLFQWTILGLGMAATQGRIEKDSMKTRMSK